MRAPERPLPERGARAARPRAGAGAAALARITTLHPRSYSEARTIGECYRDGMPVIMNLTELDEAAAKRLVDFAAGLVFAMRGGFDKVTNRVFLLTPADVEVSADDARQLPRERCRERAPERTLMQNARSSVRIEACHSPSSSSSTTRCSSSGSC